jgi:hypothetical protein
MFELQETTLNKMEILYLRLKRHGHVKEARVLARCIGESLGDWDCNKEVFLLLDEFRAEENAAELREQYDLEIGSVHA